MCNRIGKMKKALVYGKHYLGLFVFLLLTLGPVKSLTVSAEEAAYQDSVLTGEGFDNFKKICDGNRDTYGKASAEGTVTVSRKDGIGGIYIEFDRIPEKWTLTEPDSGIDIICGENAFLHEFVDIEELLGELPDKLVLSFETGTRIADIYVFSEGELPSWVQVWQPPCERADLLLISSHSDDEQLFFSGILPYYAGERGLNVQVAYMVQHFEANGVENHKRPHEQLDGLWTVGVRNYPVMSDFPDLYAESKNRQTAFSQAAAVFETQGITYDDFVGYITECLRRFQPLVVVSHDLDGEYGHGTHVMSAAALTDAIRYAADESRYPASAAQYGTWEVEKVYLHLYEENQIVMNFDVPLEHFSGKTAFEVSQDGFACHKSQHWTWFYKWMYGTDENPVRRATDIKTYSPCNYGLYYTHVGFDREGGDFFENVETYAVRDEAAVRAAEAAKEEELASVEAENARLEAEKARQEAESAKAEAALAREEAENAKTEAALLKKQLRAVTIFSGAFFALVLALWMGRFFARQHRRRCRRKSRRQ